MSRSGAPTAGEGSPSLSMYELEFICGDTLIEIIPRMQLEKLHLVSGSCGPFRPNVPIRVPLWLALTLKKRGKCTIRAPAWLSVEELQRLVAEERKESKILPVPFHYLEVGSLILSGAAQDLPEAQRVRSLLEDLENIRTAKIKKHIDDELNADKSGMTNAVAILHVVDVNALPHRHAFGPISAMEMNRVRPQVLQTLAQFETILPHDDDRDN